MTKRGISSRANKESLIAVYFPDASYQRIHYYEFPIIKELKYKNAAKTKYDIPQYICDIPNDFPLFCTIKEAVVIKNYQNKLKKKEEKNKIMKLELESKPKERNKSREKDDKNNNILEEPVPNEQHKYCHLCKKHFDNYLRHINSKTHKECNNKYSDKFNDIKDIFKRINSFWNNENKENKDINIQTEIGNNNIKIDNNVKDENYQLKMSSQFNQNIKEGCKAKKKLIIGNHSQLSTAQSFPVIPPKKRKKNDLKDTTNISKSKKNKCNKDINEFLISGEFVHIKKLSRGENIFYNNYYN